MTSAATLQSEIRRQREDPNIGFMNQPSLLIVVPGPDGGKSLIALGIRLVPARQHAWQIPAILPALAPIGLEAVIVALAALVAVRHWLRFIAFAKRQGALPAEIPVTSPDRIAGHASHPG